MTTVLKTKDSNSTKFDKSVLACSKIIGLHLVFSIQETP